MKQKKITPESSIHSAPSRFARNLAWFVIGFGIVCLMLSHYERFAGKRHFGDFHVYYLTGQRLLSGASFYFEDNIGNPTPFKYSPLIASCFALLAYLPEPVAAALWYLMNLSFLFGSTVLCLQLARQANGQEGGPLLKEQVLLGVASIAALAPTILHCLNSGQVGLAILFFFVLGVFFGSDEKNSAGGFFFALSAMFKYLPILIFPYLWFKRKGKLMLWFFGWFVIFHLLPAFWFGWEKNTSLIADLTPFLSKTTLDHISLLDVKNQSVWAYIYRLFYYDFGFFWIRNRPELVVLLGSIVFFILYGLIIKAPKEMKSNLFGVDFSLLAILIVIFNPNAWKHNFVMVLFPYLILVLRAAKAGWKQWSMFPPLLIAVLFYISNRSFAGWNARYELMSCSVLMLAALLVFAAIIFAYKRPGLVRKIP